jgi:hypothetical protein
MALVAATVAFFFQYVSLFRTAAPAVSANENFALWDQAGLGGPARELVEGRQVRGVLSLLVTTLILMAPLLYLLRDRIAPRGAATTIFGLTGVLICAVRTFEPWELILAAAVAGLVVDVAIGGLRPGPERAWAQHAVALVGPLALIGSYLSVVEWRLTIRWSIELWSGTIVYGMLVGLVLSALMAPPPSSVRRRSSGATYSPGPAELDRAWEGYGTRPPGGAPDFGRAVLDHDLARPGPSSD